MESIGTVGIVWFRRDLRISNNHALVKAIDECDFVLPLYIWSPEEEAPWSPGGASKWWLHHSLIELDKKLKEVGSSLSIAQGKSLEVLFQMQSHFKNIKVYWNRLYDPATIQRDMVVKQELEKNGIQAQSFSGHLLTKPWEVKTATKTPFQVYTPYSRAARKLLSLDIVETPKKITSPQLNFSLSAVEELKLLPTIPWDKGFYNFWKPGSDQALKNLDQFIETTASQYLESRNIPSIEGTSKLSPHLHYGEISPAEVWKILAEKSKKMGPGEEHYEKEILWREFAHHILFHFPKTPDNPLRKDFVNFPWEENEEFLHAWQKGKSGYPIVDAGMRQLWHTGWMHNRVRMIVASVLVKHLLQPWQKGTEWFWDTLVDADLAANTLGWQWASGCGADAAPYFRVFNPVLQGEKFDPEGKYVHEWVPELAKLGKKFIHQPWEASDDVMKAAGISYGESYPKPLVDVREGRDRALKAFKNLRK
jgi:deoxyribodipyrimidine photo-lyase